MSVNFPVKQLRVPSLTAFSSTVYRGVSERQDTSQYFAVGGGKRLGDFTVATTVARSNEVGDTATLQECFYSCLYTTTADEL